MTSDMPEHIEEDWALVRAQLALQKELPQDTPPTQTSPSVQFHQHCVSEIRPKFRFAVRGNAIFTGGTGRLALVNARALLEHGLTGLALLDNTIMSPIEDINALSRDFPSSTIKVLQVDITSAASVRTAVQMAEKILGGIDILCCFAGVMDLGWTHLIEPSPDAWIKMLEVNRTSALYAAQAVALSMSSARKRGTIVFIISIPSLSVRYPWLETVIRGAKESILSVKSQMAVDWAYYGIRMNTISPGYIDPLPEPSHGPESVSYRLTDRNPMRRMGNAEELTGPLILLCSDAGSYMTGADVVVDGGQSCYFKLPIR